MPWPPEGTAFRSRDRVSESWSTTTGMAPRSKTLAHVMPWPGFTMLVEGAEAEDDLTVGGGEGDLLGFLFGGRPA